MKKPYILTIFLVVLISIFLISCTGKSKIPDPVIPPVPAVNNPPSTPTYISPQNGGIIDDGVFLFRWNRSHDDGAYIVYNFFLSNDPTQLATPLYKRIQDTDKLIGGLQASTTYYWKVEAMDDLDKTTCGEVWEVFVEQDYTDDPAVPLLPADGTQDCWLNLYLSWEDADFFHDGTVVYDVYFNERYQSLDEYAHDLSATTLEVTGLDYNTEYSWKVVARNITENESVESVVSHFKTCGSRPAPTIDIAFPFEDQVDLNTAFILRWSDSVRSIGDYYVYGAEAGHPVTLIGESGVSTACTISNLDYSTEYYFYIEQRQSGGAVNISDDLHIVTKDERSPFAPDIVSPADGASEQASVVTFSWLKNGDPNDMKVYFDIYVGDSGDMLQLKRTGIDATSTTLNQLESGKKYFWRINARNVDGYESESRVVSFTTAGYVPPEEPTPTNNLPTKPVNLFPANGDNIGENDLFFDWTESTDIEGSVMYNLYISENTSFTTPIATELSTNHLFFNTLEGTKTYYWTVEAFDEQGSSTYSDPTSFTLLGM